MKKFIKTISTICLVLLLAVPMFMLAGCSKNFKIEIIVDGGHGGVFKQKTEMSVVGKNTVNGDEKFEYFISPNEGYEIESIVIDGVNETVTNSKGMYKYFEKITGDHTVVVKFKPVLCDVIFMCRNDENTEFVEVVDIRTAVKYNEYINLNEEKYGGANNKLWYYYSGSKKVYAYNGSTNKDDAVPSNESANIFYITNVEGATLYTDLTVSELIALVSGD